MVPGVIVPRVVVLGIVVLSPIYEGGLMGVGVGVVEGSERGDGQGTLTMSHIHPSVFVFMIIMSYVRPIA